MRVMPDLLKRSAWIQCIQGRCGKPVSRGQIERRPGRDNLDSHEWLKEGLGCTPYRRKELKARDDQQRNQQRGNGGDWGYYSRSPGRELRAIAMSPCVRGWSGHRKFLGDGTVINDG